MNQTVYLYGFVPASVPLPPGGLEGIEGSPVELLELDGFAAALSRVPADAYAPAAIESRLGDLDWVAGRGVQHERVVAWFVDHAQILPVRLFTLYSSPEALRAEADSRRALVHEQLRRFEGRREWDLKVAYRPDVLERNLARVSPEVAALDRELEQATPGRRYLLQRKRAAVAATETARAARATADSLLDDLAAHAERHVRVAVTREAADLPVILNAALLVRADEEPAVRELADARAAELADVGLVVVFSGPWAPYRFLAGSDEHDA